MISNVQLQRQAWLGMRRHGLAAGLVTVGLVMGTTLFAHADSTDGTFPTAEQVGGEVYQAPLKIGSTLPTDFAAFDVQGAKVDFGTVIERKRSLVVFFISAVPVSVNELMRIEDFINKNAPKVNLVFVNADTVGVALEGGQKRAISATVSTVRLIAKEHGLKRPMYVAPNDALSPTGLSNRLAFRGLPTSFLVNDKGVIEKIFVGPQHWKKGDI